MVIVPTDRMVSCQAMEVPPSEVARLKWVQAKTAAAAGAATWRNGVPADVNS